MSNPLPPPPPFHQLPPFVQQRLQAIHQHTGVPIEDIIKDYWEFRNSEFVLKDAQFVSDEDRDRYVVAVLWSRYVARPPLKEFDVIPVGIGHIRIAKKTGKKMSEIYALVKTPEGTRLRRIALIGDLVELRKNVTLFARYRVKLSEFSSGDLMADDRSSFDNPVKLPVPPREVLEKIPGIVRVPRLAEVKKYTSRIGSDGYVDKTDWRIVRGIIIKENRGERKDGSEFGVYTIMDDSLEPEPVITPDGRVLPPGFTVWVPPELMEYDVESECDFAGTITLRKDGSPEMNAYVILPVHAKRK
jgi:hypothetical protein